jgi:CelD/BcsL family acetyltransferase involved in cellulose biosynthesis
MQEGFDPLYVKGAGHVLRAKSIENCIAEGIEAYDFLGDMTDHKRRWLATERFGYDLFIAAPHMKARLLFLRDVWPTGRFLRPV